MEANTEGRSCKKCKGPMSYVDLPDFGRVWQCRRCVLVLEDDSGAIHVWKNPTVGRQRQIYAEDKKLSRKRCPECDQKMWEIVMPDFGSRWQCENCRLTVFATGGIQRWKSKPAS